MSNVVYVHREKVPHVAQEYQTDWDPDEGVEDEEGAPRARHRSRVTVACGERG